MRDLVALPRFILGLSFPVRLFIPIASLVLVIVAYMYFPMTYRNPVIFIIPVALAAWLFKKRGVFIVIACLIVVFWAYYAYFGHSYLLSYNLTLTFIINTISLSVIGLFISFQRNSFDLADEARRQLTIAYEQQQKLNGIKDLFLQNINHELRTPLTAIYGYLELLLLHHEQVDASMRTMFLEHAMQSCDELQLLVNNVLDSMSFESQKKNVRTQELAIVDIVHEVLERFDPTTLKEHIVHMDIPEYIVVCADAQYTRQIIRNLLSNAFKYAPAHTVVTVRAALHGSMVEPLHAAPEVCITVEDRGPGIPRNEAHLLFGQFVRLKRDTLGSTRGSGLGLYLSKQFVELMGGRIWVESEGIAGLGSRFSFTLPCVPCPTIKAKMQSASIYHMPAPVDIPLS